MKILEQLKGITDASAGFGIKKLTEFIEAIKALAEIAWAIFCLCLVVLPIAFAISLVFDFLKYVF